MQISKINAQPAFSGTVIMNRAKIAKEISRAADSEQAEILINNINELKKKLERETPDSKIYTIDYSKEGYKSDYIPKRNKYHTIGQEGTITVSDENFQEYGESFILFERRYRYGYWDVNKKAGQEEISQICDGIAEKAIASSSEDYDRNSVVLPDDAKKIFDKLA